MEYVMVKYYRRRTVYIDGDKSGYTNSLLRVNRGTHKFELSPPPNYTPVTLKLFVKNTIPAHPMLIEFEPKS
ncbi:MAG: hypothetical protein OEW81_12895 [Gammaproteobacteria bacterium]|nr:hypothetical protein [Gammaproteobacteria bacterium]